MDYIYSGEEIKGYYIIFSFCVFINETNWSEGSFELSE